MKLKKRLCFIALFSILSNSILAQTEGNIIFGSAQIHEIYMTFSQTNYWDSLTLYMPNDQYLTGNIIIDGTNVPNVGIKFKGNSSYNNPSDKKSFKISLNEYVTGQNVDGLKKINLNNGFKDPSFLREKLACDFYNEHGLGAPRCAFTKVYINGSYWGLYTFIEEIDTKQFLNKHFGNKQGNMFKGDPSGDLKWINSTPSSYYTKYELHTNEIINDWSDLVSFINKINNSGAYFSDSLETIFNTGSFVKQWAATNIFANLDSYIGSGHNYYVYHDTLSNKFEWVAWDVNESFGNFNMGMTGTQLKNLSMFFVSSPPGNRPLVQKMLQNNTYKTEFITTICQWLNYDFSNAALDGKIDSLANAIRTAVYADTKKFYSNQQFEDNLTTDITTSGPPPGGGTILGLKSFITARRNSLTTELAMNNCFVGIDENHPFTNTVLVYPNPAYNQVTIVFNGKEKENRITFFNTLGQETKTIISTNKTEKINTSGFSEGFYILKINEDQFQKLQISK